MKQTLARKFTFLFGFFTLLTMNAQTKIIAHRGFWKTEPQTSENSIQALKNAQNLNVYGSEFDIHMTKDGKLVVNHDDTYHNLNIATTKYCDLRKYKLSNGERIPTLKKYLKQGKKKPSTRLILEIKPVKSKELESEIVSKTLEMIKKMDVKSQVDFISFSLGICKEIKKQDSSFHVQYLNGELSPQQIKEAGLDGMDYHYSVFQKKSRVDHRG